MAHKYQPQILANPRRPGYMNFQNEYQVQILANFHTPGYMNFQKNVKPHFWPISVDAGT